MNYPKLTAADVIKPPAQPKKPFVKQEGLHGPNYREQRYQYSNPAHVRKDGKFLFIYAPRCNTKTDLQSG